MSNSATKQVLVLAAHPDDETLGCGATMAKLSGSGHHIHLLTFTDGYATRGQALEGKNRNDALEKVSEILGIQHFAFGNFPDNQMDTVPLLQVCKFIEPQVQFTPDIIFTHHPACLNVDHGIVFRAMITAFRPQLGDAKVICRPSTLLSSLTYNSCGHTLNHSFIRHIHAYCTAHPNNRLSTNIH